LTQSRFGHLILGMTLKSIVQDVGKGYTTAIGKWLLGLTVAALGTLGILAWHHQWTDSQLLSIHQTSSHLCLALLAGWGWVRFYLAWKAKRAVAAQLVKAEKQAGELRTLAIELENSSKQQHENDQKKIVELRQANEKLSSNPRLEDFLLDYDMRPANRVFFHKKNGQPYCPSCTLQGKIAPMQYLGNYWKCHLCKEKIYNGPDPNAAQMSGRPKPLPGMPPHDLGSPSLG
jgi:hypothetical protein